MRYIFIGILMMSLWNLGMAQIAKIEYFIDTDPGFNQAIPVSYSPGSDITAPLNVPLDTVSNGFHMLYLRALDTHGRWSQTYKYLFFNTDLPPTNQALAAAEYFIDEDRGFGNGTPIPVPDNQQDTTLLFQVDLTGVSPGYHTLFLRVADAIHQWSQATRHAFYVKPGGELTNIVALKYNFESADFISDTLTYQDFDPAPSVNLNFNADLSQLQAEGDYTMKIWAVGNDGSMSLVNTHRFTFREETIAVTSDKTDLSCFRADNGKITVTASKGQAPYLYKLNEGDYTTDSIFDSLPAGTYTVSVKDNKDGFGSATVEITSPATIGLFVGSKTDPTCSNAAEGTITVSITNEEEGLTYSKDGENFQASKTFENLMAGTYTLIAKKANGCMESIEVELVPQNVAPEVPNIFKNESTDPHTLTVTNAFGNLQFQWLKDGSPIIGATQSSLVCPGPGNYKVRVTNAERCSSESEEVSCGPTIVIEIDSTNISCAGEDNGTITASASGGSGPPFSYSLDGENFSEEGLFMDLPAGEYTLYAKDNEGNEGTKTVEIISPEAIAMTADTIIDASCPGNTDGSIVVSASGGNGNFTFMLNGETNEDGVFADLKAGSYTITVQDGNGCEQSTEAVINSEHSAPDPPVIMQNGNELSQKSTLTIINANGNGIIWYKDGEELEDGTGETLAITEAGEYTAIALNNEGCFSEPGEIVEVTGIDEILLAITLVYPVPAREKLTIEIPYTDAGEVTARLYNLTGALMRKSVLKASGAKLITEFDVSALPNGLYFVLLQGHDFQVIKKVQISSR